MKLTKKRAAALSALYKYPDGATAYDIASFLFGERYGIAASRARGRLMSLKRDGLATNGRRTGVWHITEAGRQALASSGVRT